MTAAAARADALNQTCSCPGVDRPRLHQALADALGDAALLAGRPHLYADHALYVSADQLAAMAEAVAAIERVIALPAWQAAVLARAPAAARHASPLAGVCMGYDFHLTPAGPRLIEINTNAGGAALNAWLAEAALTCAHGGRPAPVDAVAARRQLAAMFREEWRRARGDAPLRRLAIIDADPAGQYLYPEFLLFARLLRAEGIEVAIADPSRLDWRDGALWLEGARVDMVYNRLTDFSLEVPAHAALHAAWLADAVALTPHPRAHALHADKRNLVLLSDAAALAGLGADPADIERLLACVPRTRAVAPADADTLWAERRRLFFKPVAGYGSRGAYRGDKLTRRVWQAILADAYIAQELVPPSERVVADATYKVDLRNYAYAGEVQWVAARLYQGQTTNFRTPGGGFAPLRVVD